MYRISIVNCYAWVLLLVPLGVIGVALAAFVVIVVMTNDGSNDTLQTVAGICIFPAALFLIAGFIGLYSYFDAFHDGMQLILDDHLTIEYPWPIAKKVYNWEEIGGIQAVDEQYRLNETPVWAPILLDGGIDLSMPHYEERLHNVRKYRILRPDRKKMVEIDSHTELTFKIQRWLSRKMLSDVLKLFKGTITWKGDAPQMVSLRNVQFEEGQWEFLRDEWLSNFAGLEELDLSGTNLTDAALENLDTEEFQSLKKVRALGTRISLQALTRLNSLLDKRAASANQFNFG